MTQINRNIIAFFSLWLFSLQPPVSLVVTPAFLVFNRGEEFAPELHILLTPGG